MNIYVGNLARTVTEEALRQLFSAYGEVTIVKIIKDKFTGDPRGFGFVEMPNQDEAQKALDGLNGHDLEQQRIRVNEARPPEARGPRTGGSSYGGGNRFRNDRGGNDRNDRSGSRFGGNSNGNGGFGYSRPKW
jgi:RNA recognition motif-containing protein